MSVNKVIILIEGGVLQAVYSTDPALEYVLLDRDNYSVDEPTIHRTDQPDGVMTESQMDQFIKEFVGIYQVVDFGSTKDVIQGYPFEGREEDCRLWLEDHQEIYPDGSFRYMIRLKSK